MVFASYFLRHLIMPLNRMIFDVNSLLFPEFVAIYAVIYAVSLVLPHFLFAVLQLLF